VALHLSVYLPFLNLSFVFRYCNRRWAICCKHAPPQVLGQLLSEREFLAISPRNRQDVFHAQSHHYWTVYAFSLSAFTALGGTIEMLMLFLNGFLVLILHLITSTFIQRHAAIGVSTLATKRLLAFSCFTITAIIYITILLNTEMPDYIDPTSLRASVDAASQQVASQCPFINISLKGVQEFTATQWFYMVGSTGFIGSVWLKYASWLVFLSFSSLALMGMSLLSAELTVSSSRHTTISEG